MAMVQVNTVDAYMDAIYANKLSYTYVHAYTWCKCEMYLANNLLKCKNAFLHEEGRWKSLTGIISIIYFYRLKEQNKLFYGCSR